MVGVLSAEDALSYEVVATRPACPVELMLACPSGETGERSGAPAATGPLTLSPPCLSPTGVTSPAGAVTITGPTPTAARVPIDGRFSSLAVSRFRLLRAREGRS